MLLSSAYGFAHAAAKVEAGDHFFTGFPSYWNIVVVYLYILQLPQMVNAIILAVLAVLVFVPLRYIYPSRTRTLQMPTLMLGAAWAALFTWMIFRLPATDGPWTAAVARLSGLVRGVVAVAARPTRRKTPLVSPLVIIFVTVFIDLLGFGIIIPLLPFYAESFGASAFTIGLLGTSFSLMQFLFSPVWGRWSDQIGRKPIILLGLLGSCLSYVTLALASSLTLLFVARIIGGIAGANIPTAQAYIADITTPENRARGMGLVGAAFGLGFIFGPAIGGLLSRVSPETPMWCRGGAVLRQLRGRVVPAARVARGHRVDQDARPAWRRSGTR